MSQGWGGRGLLALPAILPSVIFSFFYPQKGVGEGGGGGQGSQTIPIDLPLYLCKRLWESRNCDGLLWQDRKQKENVKFASGLSLDQKIENKLMPGPKTMNPLSIIN